MRLKLNQVATEVQLHSSEKSHQKKTGITGLPRPDTSDNPT